MGAVKLATMLRYGFRYGRSRVNGSGDYYSSVEDARESLEMTRDSRNRTYSRQNLTLSLAKRRADAGDTIAARRVEWIATVGKARQRAQWLLDRFKVADREATKLLLGGPPCASCAGRLEQAQRFRADYAAELAAMPTVTPTWRAYVATHEVTSRRVSERRAMMHEQAARNAKAAEYLARIDGPAPASAPALRVLPGGRQLRDQLARLGKDGA
jgi:hypothetical protein